MSDEQNKTWEETVAFHGHACPGLAIGVRAATDYKARIKMSGRSADEEIVAIVETDACGVDGIQVILGCTVGKGNLWVARRGKHVFTFFQRTTGAGLRFAWKNLGLSMHSHEEKIQYFLTGPAEDLYTVGAAHYPMPAGAVMYPSHACSACGEPTAEPHVRVKAGQIICRECAGENWVLTQRFS